MMPRARQSVGKPGCRRLFAVGLAAARWWRWHSGLDAASRCARWAVWSTLADAAAAATTQRANPAGSKSTDENALRRANRAQVMG